MPVLVQPILGVGAGWVVRLLAAGRASRFPSGWAGYIGETWDMDYVGSWRRLPCLS